MALLEFPLDAVEVGGVEVVAVVGAVNDIVVDGAFLNGARPVRVIFILARVGHGERGVGRQAKWLVRELGREGRHCNARRGSHQASGAESRDSKRGRLRRAACMLPCSI